MISFKIFHSIRIEHPSYRMCLVHSMVQRNDNDISVEIHIFVDMMCHIFTTCDRTHNSVHFNQEGHSRSAIYSTAFMHVCGIVRTEAEYASENHKSHREKTCWFCVCPFGNPMPSNTKRCIQMILGDGNNSNWKSIEMNVIFKWNWESNSGNMQYFCCESCSSLS